METAIMPVVCGVSRDVERKECMCDVWNGTLTRRRGASREHRQVKKGNKVYGVSVCIFDTLRVN